MKYNILPKIYEWDIRILPIATVKTTNRVDSSYIPHDFSLYKILDPIIGGEIFESIVNELSNQLDQTVIFIGEKIGVGYIKGLYTKKDDYRYIYDIRYRRIRIK